MTQSYTETSDKKPHKLSKRDIKYLFRHAFAVVVDNFNHVRSVLGTAQAVDYARMFEGSGKAKSSSTSTSYPLTDFVIDVENAVKRTLDPNDTAFFYNNLVGKPLDLSVQSDHYIDMQERLGRTFMSRGIFPLQRYFTVFKR